MRRFLLLSILFNLGSCLYAADVKLPTSLRLAGPLNPAKSQFGDEFYNFPPYYGGRAHPGQTFQSGQIEFRFSAPVDNISHFTMTYDGVGTSDGIVFPGGQMYALLDNRVFENPLFANEGDLDLKTGEVTNFAVHSIFRNSTISRVTKNIRIPFGFVSDYPPTTLPVDLPFTDRPEVSTSAKFKIDSTGNITGFEFAGVTIAPVTLFPSLGLFPPFSFGDSGRFYFANPIGCVEGTPPENCPNNQTNPDGVLLAPEAFFHPHLELVTDELKEQPATTVAPPCQPKGTASGNGLVALSGKLFQLGGFDGSQVSSLIQVYDPGANRWETVAPMITPVMAASSAVIGSRIFVAGGFNPGTGKSTDLLQAYDPAQDSWSLRKPATLAVSGAGAAQVEGRLFVIGGWTNDTSGSPVLTNRVQIYDPAADTWSYGASAPLAIAGSAAVAVGSKIYLVNGRTDPDVVTDRVFIYDTSADSWQESPQTTLFGVYEAAAGYIENRIYLVGGRRTVGGPSEQILQTYEIALSEWRKGLEPLIPTAASAAAALDGRLYIVGGRIMTGADETPGRVTDQFQVYDPGLGWGICDSHPLFTSAMVMSEAAGVAAPRNLSPGTRAVILGFNFAGSVADAAGIRPENGLTTNLPTTLQGITIRLDGKPVPLLRVAPRQVEFVMPYNIDADPAKIRKATLELVKEGLTAQQPAVEIPLLAVAPAIYVYNYNEFRYPTYLEGATAIARNQDGSLNYPNNPSHPGQVVTLRMTGLGAVSPALQTGERAVSPLPKPVRPLNVTIGGKPANIVSASLATGEVGVYEVQVTVPSDSPKGNNVPVEVAIGGIRSNLAMISVR